MFFNICSYAAISDLNTSIQNAKQACSGIDASLSRLKTMAGVNTAVTAVGTVSGGVALGTGIAKAHVDSAIESWEQSLNKMIQEERKSGVAFHEISTEDVDKAFAKLPKTTDTLPQDITEMKNKSKTLGNIRTGTLAASTATNIAGTAIAATNQVDENLQEKINMCISAVKNLSDAKLAAKVENTATESDLAIADRIITACRDYEFVDIKPINKRATGAAVASGIGIGTGVVGTITSAVANTDKTRAGDATKEKNLNTTANVMAGASTGASAVATIFNATQIAAIKKVATVAETCEGALK